MKKDLSRMTNDEMINFVASEVQEYKHDREALNPYGAVKLHHIQAYERHIQRATYFSEKGRAVHSELKQILLEDARIGGKVEPKKIKSLYEVYQEMNCGYGQFKPL